MKKHWTTTKLIAAGSFGVLLAILELGGGGIAAVTGIPGTSGLFNSIVEEILVVICLFVINEFGAATIMRTILGILVLPLPVIGTPGFLPKIGVATTIGIIADLLYLTLKKQKRIASCVIGGASEVSYLFVFLVVGRWFGMPGIEKTTQLMLSPLFIVGALIVGGISGYLGYLIYQKLKDTAIVRRIQ